MKVYLLMKQIIKENYKYLLTLLLSYGFLAVLYHVGNNDVIKFYAIPMMAYALTLGNAIILPNILFKNYYHQTNTSHIASIPMKRLEIFASLYFVGIGLSIAMILGYSCMTTLMGSTLDQFIAYSSTMLVTFAYYYHLSLFAFFMCGHFFFEGVVITVLVFGPLIAYLVYNWALSTYDSTYYAVMNSYTIAKLIPVVGGAFYWFEIDASQLYGLYLMTAAIFMILTILLVQKRPYERVGQSIMFRGLSYVVRSVAVLLALAALYAIFGSILEAYDYTSHLVTCIIVGIMAAYIVEMIYVKKTRVFYSIKYGILAAFIVFGSVHLGSKMLEGYIPGNFDGVYFEVNNHFLHSYGERVFIEDQTLCDLVVDLNEELMDAHVDGYDTYGNVYIQYCNEDGEPFFGRRYNFTKVMFEKTFSNKDYRFLFIDSLTAREKDLLELVAQRKPITFKHGYTTVDENNPTYTLDTEAEFYLFENYLKQELEAFYNRETIEFKADREEKYYFEYSLLPAWDGTIYDWLRSELVYNALAKTFNF